VVENMNITNIPKNLLKKRAKKALQALFVADSLAMPVHWYYRVSDIYKDFPKGIHQFEDAPSRHPSSIMSMHSKQQGGRKYLNSSKNKNIVGDVILKGKEKYWGQTNIHYHHGMKAGENTLNAHCVRVLLQSIIDTNGRYDRDYYLENYISMMTAEKTHHKDTYAESYHRGFFANYIKGKDISDCGAITHDTASIGGLVSIGPLAIILFLSGFDLLYVQSQCANHLHTTHPDKFLSQVCNNYVELIENLLFRDQNQDCFEIILMTLNKSIKLNFKSIDLSNIEDSSIVGGKFSTACYITDSWPSVLFLAAKYSKNIDSGLLANTNLGGDNVHRGAVLGSLLGLCNDKGNLQLTNWYSNLIEHRAIDSEIEYLLNIID
jgi:ADP-ribosylglycohydrolase